MGVLFCVAPLLIFMNMKGQVIAYSKNYKRPDPHVQEAIDVCRRYYLTCPSTITIHPDDKVDILCEELPYDNN